MASVNSIAIQIKVLDPPAAKIVPSPTKLTKILAAQVDNLDKGIVATIQL